MTQVTVETCLRHLEQITEERGTAIAALRKIEAILLTPLLKGNGYTKDRHARMLAICHDTCTDLEARTVAL